MNSPEHIVLVDDEGVEHTFIVHALIDFEQHVYALLRSLESDGEVVILRVEGAIEDGHLITLDDDEWDRVAAYVDTIDALNDDDV